jgi:hypothetical protein
VLPAGTLKSAELPKFGDSKSPFVSKFALAYRGRSKNESKPSKAAHLAFMIASSGELLSHTAAPSAVNRATPETGFLGLTRTGSMNECAKT